MFTESERNLAKRHTAPEPGGLSDFLISTNILNRALRRFWFQLAQEFVAVPVALTPLIYQPTGGGGDLAIRCAAIHCQEEDLFLGVGQIHFYQARVLNGLS